MVLLAFAQFINVATGAVHYLLAMCGHETELRNLGLAASVAIIVLNLALIPAYGLYGAAIAMTIVVIGQNLIATWVVRKRVGIQPLPLPW